MRLAFSVHDTSKAARRVFAILAAICFFLPLGQCTQKESEPAGPGIHISGTHQFVPAEEIELPPKSMERFGFDLLLFLPFVWPLLLAMFSSRVRSPTGLRILLGLEVVASAISLYWIGGIWLRIYSEIQPAGYIVVGTFLGYLALSLFEAGSIVLLWFSRKRSAAGSH